MCQLAVAIPDAVLYETKMSKDETLDFVRRTLAVEYYRTLGVSLGYCAKIAGMDKEDFIRWKSRGYPARSMSEGKPLPQARPVWYT